MLINIQCGSCKFRESFKWDTSQGLPGKYKCSQFTDEIPIYVEEGTQDCPKFKERE